jgi:signal transduction histidine kinase
MPKPPLAIAAEAQRIGRLRPLEPAWLEAPEARRAARGRRVARDLIELSRLQRGDEQAQCAQTELASLLREVCAGYAQLCIVGPDPLSLSTDSRRLLRVISLLLDNAVLHGQPPLRLRYDASEVVVEDSGPGLEPKLLEHATEPFITGRRARGRGVGLGLAIAARQAAVLGAELSLSNAPSGGAVARLRFHAGQAAAQCSA